jgi:hypothetical protein
MMKKALAAVLFILFFAVGCERDLPTREMGNANAPRNVLIAGTQSKYKLALIDKLAEALGPDTYRLKVEGLSALAAESLDKYGAIVLMSSMMAGRLDARLKESLAKDPTNPKVIVYFTRGTDDPLPKNFKLDMSVDAITSASDIANVAERASELAALIEKKFQ